MVQQRLEFDFFQNKMLFQLELNWAWQWCFPNKCTWPQWKTVDTAHGCL